MYLLPFESLLCKLAEIIGAQYEKDSFAKAAECFYETYEDEEEWRLEGLHGYVCIVLERGESYLHTRFWANQPHFQKGKEVLWDAYIAQGGNPEWQKRP